MDRVMRLKPAKHGRRLDGKRVITTGKNAGVILQGTYCHFNDQKYFGLKYPNGLVRKFLKADWTVEEIVETEE